MAFPSTVIAVTKDKLKFARVASGASIPAAYTFQNVGAVLAGAGTITLDMTLIDGAAAAGTVELEHDQPILFASSNTVAVDGAGTLGSYTTLVDDGANALPTNLVAVGDYIKFAGDSQFYQIVERTAQATEYKLRLNPELKAAPADNAAVTVYNTVRLNLGTGVQYVDIDTTGVSVPVTGVTYPIADATASEATYAYKALLGAETISPSATVDSTDITNMEFSTSLKGDVGFEIAASGQWFVGNGALREMILPNLLDADRSAESLYVLFESNEGTKVEGPAQITDNSAEGTAGDARTYDITVSVTTGSNFGAWFR